MKIVTSPSRKTLAGLGLEPAAGLGEFASHDDRRASMLAWRLNHWAIAGTGGTMDCPWLGRISAIARHSLTEFRHRLDMLDGALSRSSGNQEPVFCGWDFLLTSGLWVSSREDCEFHLFHAGFEKECQNLAEETGLPLRLAEPLLRSLLAKLFRRTLAGGQVFLLSLHEDEATPQAPADLLARVAQAEELADTEMVVADPLPRGSWRLKKGDWNIAATDDDFEVVDVLRRIGNPRIDFEIPALAFGRDFEQKAAPVSPRAYREVRTVELRGIERAFKERASSSAGQNRRAKSKPSFFRDFLKRIFSRKRSS